MFWKSIKATNSTTCIAKNIINRCLRRGNVIYPAKLEIMMIIAYGEYLIKTGNRLFNSKISVSKNRIKIKEIQSICKGVVTFDRLFTDDRMLLWSEEAVIRKLIDEYGNKNFAYVDSDPRIRALKELRRIKSKISDKDIIDVFRSVKAMDEISS